LVDARAERAAETLYRDRGAREVGDRCAVAVENPPLQRDCVPGFDFVQYAVVVDRLSERRDLKQLVRPKHVVALNTF
jgi:hypothetical protein